MKKLLINLIFFAHLLWTLLLLFGTVFIFFARWYVPWHITIVTGTLLLNLALGHCPLTKWEEKLRKSSSPDFSYHDSFMSAVLSKFGIKISPRDVLWITGILKAFAYGVAIAFLVAGPR